jgi:dsDNA-binding SOS-regulon protein
MSNLVPDPDRAGSQISQNSQDVNDLSFQELIDRQKKLLTPDTDFDEYNKRLEIVNKTFDLIQKDLSIKREEEQEQIKIEIAKIELKERQIKLTESKIKAYFRLIASPVFTIGGVYLIYTSDSLLGSGLLFLGLRLALSNEDAMKGIDAIKDLFAK